MVVDPAGKMFPAGTPERATVTPEQLSVADAAPRSASLMNAAQIVAPGPVPLFTAAGAVMFGFSASRIVTVNVQLVEPQEFVAVAVTVVAPTGNEEPDAGE